MTHDIVDLMTTLVSAWKENHRLELVLNEAGPTETREYRVKIKENEKVMESAATELVATVLSDIHRIADAAELLCQFKREELEGRRR